VQQHVLYEFIWIHRTCDYMLLNFQYRVLFSSRVRVRISTRFSVWLVSCYTHVLCDFRLYLLHCPGTPAKPYTWLHIYTYFEIIQLLLVPRMAPALSAKVFIVSAPSVWNSLSFDCRSAELSSSFQRSVLKTELFDVAYTEHLTSLRHHVPPIRL